MTISNNIKQPSIDPDHTLTQSDQVRPSQTESDLVRLPNWVTLDEVERQFIEASLPRTRTLLARYCRQGRLRGVKDAGPNGDEWYVDPDSIPLAITELKRIGRQGTTPTDPDPVRPSLTPPADQTPEQHSDAKKALKNGTPTDPDPVRLGQTDPLDVYNHPAFKRMEKEADYWKDEYRQQVKVTQTIQRESFDKLVELQRMVQVGQSRTLADFFIKTKEWLVGQNRPDDGLLDSTPSAESDRPDRSNKADSK